jgi:drug/metabolite transporter (DMT)-like permease
MNPAILGLILLGVLLNSGAQILLKMGMRHIGHFTFTLNNFFPIAWQVALSPWIIIGIACYVISVLVWLLVLSRTDVSIAYPMVSLGYVISAIAAYFWLGEHVTLIRMTGIFIILFGVYLVARS